MRHTAKVDSNQKDLVKQLRDLGAEVQHLHQLGGGVPDILVAFRGRWFVAEIKDGSKPLSKQKLTEHEAAWHKKFSDFAPVLCWTCIDDALRDIGNV